MNAWRYLLALLLGFIRPAATQPGTDDDPPEVDPNASADDPPGDADADETETPPADADEAEHETPPADSKAELAAARAETERYQRELTELRAAQRPPPKNDLAEQEDAVLNDPKATPLEKWQIQANRELRAGRQASQSALAQAYDVADKTTFAALALKEPALFKRYESRVEEELTKMRRNGQNTNREAIYTYLLGKDMREGKFKKKAAPASTVTTAQRGRLPGARSDVAGRNAMSEHEKRAKRLENQQI